MALAYRLAIARETGLTVARHWLLVGAEASHHVASGLGARRHLPGIGPSTCCRTLGPAHATLLIRPAGQRQARPLRSRRAQRLARAGRIALAAARGEH